MEAVRDPAAFRHTDVTVTPINYLQDLNRCTHSAGKKLLCHYNSEGLHPCVT